MSTEGKNLRPEKKAMYNEVQEHVSGALYMILADYTGMSMPETTEFKKQLRGAEAKVKIVKNSMLQRLCEDFGQVTGPTAMVFGEGDVVEVAKILKKFSAQKEKPVLKGGMLEGSVLSAEDVAALAKLPGKKELQAKLVGTLAAPMTQVVGVMNQKVCSLLYVLNAVREKKEQAA
ncbi:50S ribosomal protein L10 [Tichowtungia aerotolerans]|uniref:Large ribosomal subunit protein uL10 n=1 Tax=Tichowtungia aerotolerans TaxID=2697043 RepID=A0A6P1M786_9BACT|nr:50S ribosomal protein L10 [Tichowtungia aerotolerans]QHI68434.1 50S ribosomal protein L10 [Tichowtungia aerotolerans]